MPSGGISICALHAQRRWRDKRVGQLTISALGALRPLSRRPNKWQPGPDRSAGILTRPPYRARSAKVHALGLRVSALASAPTTCATTRRRFHPKPEALHQAPIGPLPAPILPHRSLDSCPARVGFNMVAAKRRAVEPTHFSAHDGEDAGARQLPHQSLVLIAIRFMPDCGCGSFGKETVSTPLLNVAETLSSSTFSTGIRRSNRP